jgi:ABC-type multidrug transport system fused ATPase/permease subunit
MVKSGWNPDNKVLYNFRSMALPQTQPSVQISFKEYATFLQRYLRPRLNLVIYLAVVLFTNISLQLINPLILRNFIDTARAGGAMSILTRMGLTFIGIALAHQLINVLVVFITENLGWGATNDLRQDMARRCLGLDMSFHAAHTPGEMIERIDGDVMALANFFSQFILQVFGNILLVGGILVVLLGVDWRISLALGTFVVITMIVLLRLANIAVPSWEAERQASADLYGFLEERISGTEDIRSNNARSYVLDRFYRLTRELMRRTIKAGLKLNILLNTTWVLFAVGNAVALIISAYLYNQKEITLGTVYMITYYTNMLTWPLEMITRQMQDLQRAGASLIRIMGIQRIKGKIAGEDNFDLPASPKLRPGALALVFKQVTFGYSDSVSSQTEPAAAIAPQTAPVVQSPKVPPPDATQSQAASLLESAAQTPQAPRIAQETKEEADKEMVLCNIDFALRPGRVIGLLGRTGSGKTTLTRLIFRLYDPDQGSIHLGAEEEALDIRQVPLQELRRRVGMVTQNIQLFHATVRENLTFFDPDIPDERILQALRDLDLWDWYLSLPKGLDTELESGGGGLSAGEAQLLAFTRIFLRDPGLVILDEATSRLDPATEHRIELAVDKLTHERTAIIVAHRLGTVHRADDILILEDGEIVEYGERARLAENPESHFYHLLQTGLEEVLV